MKNRILIIIAIYLSFGLQAQTNVIQSHFKEGLYKFDDSIKILSQNIFINYATKFGLASSDSMSLKPRSSGFSAGNPEV